MATWFRLELLPFYYVNRLATLEIDGHVVIGLERTQRRIESDKNIATWVWGFWTVFVLSIAFLFWRLASKAERRASSV